MKQPTLAELKRLRDAATQGEWIDSGGVVVREPNGGRVAILYDEDGDDLQGATENAPFIAYAANHAVAIAEREAAMVDKAVKVLENLQGDRCFCEYDSSQLTDYPMDDHSGECKAATKLLAEVAEMRNQEAGE